MGLVIGAFVEYVNHAIDASLQHAAEQDETKRSNHIKRPRRLLGKGDRRDFVVSVPVETQRVSRLQNRLFAEVKMVPPSEVLDRTWRKRGVLKACVEGECYNAWSNYH